jgi:hypothetical protein
MKVGAVNLYKHVPSGGQIVATVHGSQIHECRAVCDVTFAEPDGRIVAELEGVEPILRPDESLA